MKKNIAKSKKFVVTVYFILKLFVILAMIAQIFLQNWNNIFLCILTLLLFWVPDLLTKKFNIELPSVLEVTVILFIFAALILGEISYFYKAFPYWDLILHTINGFICAGIGFSLIDILNKNEKIHLKVNSAFLTIVAFCFSMTIGILWEFCEYGVDTLTNHDMQKDSIVTQIKSVALNEEGKNKPVTLDNIKFTKVYTYENGELKETTIEGGYLDIGLHDTMQDLMVNFIGAFVFSVLGYLYIKNRDKYKVAENFMMRRKTDRI